MINNEHILSGKKDQWFLQQNRTEGVTGNTFQAGDHIVVCDGCKRVWLAESWNVKNRCPSSDCRSQKTRPFQKNIFALKSTEKMRIKFRRSQTIKVVPVKKAGKRKVSHPRLPEIWNRITHVCYRVFPDMKNVLVGVAIGLTVLQVVFSTSVFTEKPAVYYRTAIAGKFQKVGESFSGNLSDMGTSVGDLFLKVKTSAGDAFVKVKTSARIKRMEEE